MQFHYSTLRIFLRKSVLTRRLWVVSLTLLVLLMATATAWARGTLNGDLCHVEADTVIEGDLFVVCTELVIEGQVEGHVIGLVRKGNLTETARVGGSIYLAGGELNVDARVGKDVHFGGLALHIGPNTDFVHRSGGVISANLSQTVAAGVEVPGNITDLGYQLVVEGSVNGEINFWGSALQLDDHVGDDITATVGDSGAIGTASQIEPLLLPLGFDIELVDPGLMVGEDAVIEGQLTYTGPTEGVILGTLALPPIFESTAQPLVVNTAGESARALRRYLSTAAREFLTLAIVAGLCLLLIPRQMQTANRNIQTRPISTVGVGMLSFIMSFPIVLIIALISLLLVVILSLLPLRNLTLFVGVTLGLGNVGVAAAFYFVAIFIARVFFALVLGRAIRLVLMRSQGEANGRWLFIEMAIGLAILSLIVTIPIFGWVLNALALFFGLGAIIAELRTYIARIVEGSSPVPTPPTRYTTQTIPRFPFLAEDARKMPPPILDDLDDVPGASDLPEGFDWWGEE